ncbi:unnamed protein product [Polarella glacialis]|uniref:CRAL-TRIO domain-containing protein n=1 Tax=Polarella glacialis TaxID=89957 RepID=A0A813ICA0_POLGL|nr:unnamed protein product [Polarella glacialis]CAE8648068.1 unnamed protein product [Polarella glacialis]
MVSEAGSSGSGGPSTSSTTTSPTPQLSLLGRASQFLRLITCRRRRSDEELQKEALKRYSALTAQGAKVPEKKQKEWYDKLAWWTDAQTKLGARIFVLAPRGPQGEAESYVDMSELLGFALSKMHQTVVVEDQKYALVWVQLSDHRVWPWTPLQIMDSLDPRYSKNLEAVHVVHPSWMVRFLRLALWPIASEEFWDLFWAHERIEFLDSHVDMKKFRLPKDVQDYDKFLDQQASELNKQQAAKYGGGFMAPNVPDMNTGGPTSGQDEQKHALQMEELKRLLQQKGFDGMKQD